MKKKLMKRILAVVCAAAIAATQIPYGTLNTIYAAGVEEGIEKAGGELQKTI